MEGSFVFINIMKRSHYLGGWIINGKRMDNCNTQKLDHRELQIIPDDLMIDPDPTGARPSLLHRAS